MAGQMLVEFAVKGRQCEQEAARVPEKPFVLNQLARGFLSGLFAEAHDAAKAGRYFVAGLDVAKPALGTARLDGEHVNELGEIGPRSREFDCIRENVVRLDDLV